MKQMSFILFVMLPFFLLAQENSSLAAVMKKEHINILDIGNSYTVHSAWYIDQLLDGVITTENCKHSHYITFRTDATFKNWYDMYYNKDIIDSYYVKRISGTRIDAIATYDIIYSNKNEGAATINGWAFRKALVDAGVKWDIIIIHQSSRYSHDYDSWVTDGNAGYFDELYKLIKETNPQAIIGTYLIHSYRSGYSNAGITYPDSYQRWEDYATAIKKLQENYDIDFVIPYGTAVQNLRTAYPEYTHEFSYDGIHLSDGLGRYVASCCYFQSLYAPIYGVSILGNTFRPMIDGSTSNEVAVDDDNATVAQKAAIMAVEDMYNVNNPKDYSDIEIPIIDNKYDNGVYYDLQGRAVDKPQRGIYILNGKKIFVN